MMALTGYGQIPSENLQFFRETLSLQAEFYFKRSYNDELLAYNAGEKCKLYPLGLNYPVTSRENKVDKIQFDFKSWVKYKLKGNEWLSRKLKAESRKQYDISNFEYLPVSQNKEPKILFLTRLWNPGTLQKDKLTDTELYETNIRELHEINTVRAQSIIECKKLFGKQFTGGLFCDSYSVEKFPELVVSGQVSSKESYLKTVKQSDICIATTGLHKSTGWKMGEYVAAARGIITEKINFDLPGNFSSPANYLEFNNVQQLLDNVSLLLDNRDMLREMMLNNYKYYNLYVRPDNLVLNTLLTVKAHTDA